MIPSSIGADGEDDGAGDGSGPAGLWRCREIPSTSPVPSASSSELPPMASGSSVSSGCLALYVDGVKLVQARTSFINSSLAQTERYDTSNQ